MLWPVRLVARVGVGVIVLVVLAVGATWVWFRMEAKSWEWWNPPAVLTIHGRHYDRASRSPVSLTAARSRGTGTWKRISTEWPMGWGVWADELPRYDPTVVYLCTNQSHCIDYALQGGP